MSFGQRGVLSESSSEASQKKLVRQPSAVNCTHCQSRTGLAVDTNLGWKGAEKYVATAPQIFDLWQDPQERYDIFMNNFKESTWIAPVMVEELKKLMKTYVDYPPRKLQSLGYTGPITLSSYQRFQWIREQLQKERINLTLPTGN